jgi:hypothetical protein
MSRDGFDELVIPLIEYLNDNYHPHAQIIIDCNSAEIVEGVKCYSVDQVKPAVRLVYSNEKEN